VRVNALNESLEASFVTKLVPRVDPRCVLPQLELERAFLR
jgi:hypothetical protein